MTDHSDFSGYSERDVQREVTELQGKSATAARLFDIRRIIGGLFVLYGVIVTLAGITASDAEIDKAEGVNINLWTGLGMLALGLFFLGWLWLRPAAPPVEGQRLGEEKEGGSG
ncbi:MULTISPECIES: hypothetical protein [unclassified Streptomyces]|uniref:hypothetical protein n=1 Tax=unclassified Streptomyces TaxID=2593676 RepID=UPI002E7A4E07|nr:MULTISPECIES: hypothetical protein [unclassified Streptomyces]MEE1758195.1 hypothetical protein [Streptomyces sp. SP18BB07]MEE1830374.1 hypothetical protein [Streptomyces sp. SP17KL33]